MIKTFRVRPASQNADGSLMFPGVWIETYVRMQGTDAWFLVGFEPDSFY